MESNFKKDAISPKGAAGWFQFMPATAKEYGLDDPSDFHASADAAGRKMRDLMKKHGGNLDYALVDYNGGGRAVDALKSGAPWKESAGYLAKFHGQTLGEIAQRTYTPAPLGEQFTSQTTVSPTDGPSATGLAYANQQHDNEYGGIVNGVLNLPRAVGLGFETQNSVYNFWKDQGVNSSTGPEVDWSAKDTQDTLKQFPEQHWGYLTQALTQDGLAKRAARLKEVSEKEQELGKLGLGPALIGGIAGGLPDLPTLIGFLPGVGGAGLLTKASRLQNALRMGAMGAATNVAYDAVANQYKPTATAHDLYASAAFGLGFGALTGGAASLKKIALADDMRALERLGMSMGKKAMREEIGGAQPKVPAAALPGEAPAVAPGWNKAVDDWLNDRPPAPPERPPVAILHGGDEKPPGAPKLDEPAIPPRAPAEPPAGPPVASPAPNPNGKPWAPEWDTPRFSEGHGGGRVLELPPLTKLSHMADYIRTHSPNADYVALMDRALKGIDLRKIKFEVIDSAHDIPRSRLSAEMAGASRKAYGAVYTPAGSTGDGLEMFLRGRGWGAGQHGLNEETFIHEALHAATVYKMRRVESGNHAGMKPEAVRAVKELNGLYREVIKHATAGNLPDNYANVLKNSKEFVAYGLTNRRFQEWLKTVDLPGERTTLWTRFTNGLRKVLGLSDKESHAYARLVDLSDHLTRKAGIEGKAKATPEAVGTGSVDYHGDGPLAGISEDAYIARINPGNVRRAFDEPMPQEAFDGLSAAGRLLGTSRTRDGRPIRLVAGTEVEGSVMAVVDGKVVGYMAPEGGTTGLFVSDPLRGNGVGEALSTAYRSRDPFAPSGGLSDAGERTARKAFRNMREAALEPVGDFIDHATVAAANAAHIPQVFGWGLGLENKLMSAKMPAAVRDLAGRLFGTTVGYKGHGVVQANVWDDTLQRAEGWTASMRKTAYPAFERWAKDRGFKASERGEAFDAFGEQVGNYVRGFQGAYHPEVEKAGNHLRALYAGVVDEINNPSLRGGGVKRGLTEVEVPDPATGQTMLVGKLGREPNYLPRKHDATKWDAAVARWGRDGVERWWANAYLKRHQNSNQADADKWSGWYVRTVEEAHMNRSADHLEEMMSGYDEKALLESLQRNGGFTQADAHRVVAGMFRDPSSDAGRTASSLRHRNLVDETHTEQWVPSGGGSAVDITINDFIKSNALDVSESYFRRTASSIALADRLDIYKQSDIGRAIDTATERTFGQSGFTDADAVSARKHLKFAVDRIQGIPQEEFSFLNKSMQMWRDFNVIRLMGGAVWNQASELSQIVGSMGWKATLSAVGELRALRRDIATGKAPHDILDHLENTIGGSGSEYVARMDFSPSDEWVRNAGDKPLYRGLDRLDSGLKKAAKGVLDYTGMSGLMVQQKRIHAIALANHFINDANGRPVTKFLSPERLEWMGLSAADYGHLKNRIAAYSSTAGQGSYGAKVSFDFARFARDEPEMHSKLMNAIHRESRRVVQENDLASMVPIMGTTLGKTVFQFMNFSIHGWNKSLMFAMNHRDFSTLSTVLHGSLFASLAYMGRTQLSAMGMAEDQRQEYLDKRLATKQIVANSFGRISQASLLPTAYDTTLGNFTGAMFAGTRTTSDVTSFASNPTLQAVNGVLSLGKMVRNGVSDDLQTTSRDIKTWGKLLPLNNTALVAPFLNALASDYPTDEDATK